MWWFTILCECLVVYYLSYVNMLGCVWVVYSLEAVCPKRLPVDWGDSELPLLLPGLQRERAGPCDLSSLWKTLLPAVGPDSLSTTTIIIL